MQSRHFLAFALVAIAGPAWPQGNPVGPEFRVNTSTTGFQERPSVAADSSSGFVVVWSGQDGNQDGIFAQRYAASGAPLGPEFRVNTQTVGYRGAASVAADLSGNFVVVWHGEQDGSALGIFGQRYASSGSPLGQEFRVNTYTTNNQTQPCVAADPSGNFVVVWDTNGQDGSFFGIVGQRYANSGTPIGAEFQVNTYTTSYQRAPSAATDSSGNFVVAWQSFDQDGYLYAVVGQRYASTGTPVGPEFRVNTTTSRSEYAASVASDASGNFIVVWRGGDDFGNLIFGQRYASSGTALGGEFRVNTQVTGNPSSPSIGADLSGNFVVAWVNYDGSSLGIIAQRFAGSGALLGSEFRVNTYTTLGQSQPSVAVDSFGNFVVAWNSYGQDGSDNGVFGQRYSMIVPVELMHFRVE